MAIKKASKKATKKTASTKRGAYGSKSKSGKTRKLIKRPPQEPIIVGGGSVLMFFEKNFKVKTHSKHKFKHEDDSREILQVVFLTSVDENTGAITGSVTRSIPLRANEKAVAICYTGSNCPR